MKAIVMPWRLVLGRRRWRPRLPAWLSGKLAADFTLPTCGCPLSQPHLR